MQIKTNKTNMYIFTPPHTGGSFTIVESFLAVYNLQLFYCHADIFRILSEAKKKKN